MYMKNNNGKKYRNQNYMIRDFPPNYSGQYTKDSLLKQDKYENNNYIELLPSGEKTGKESRPAPNAHDEHIENKEHSRQNEDEKDFKEVININNSSDKHIDKNINDTSEHQNKAPFGGFANIFKQRDKGNGIPSNLFSGKKIKNIFNDLDFEDLILLGVMFFLLRDGAEDDLLIILAIILFTGG